MAMTPADWAEHERGVAELRANAAALRDLGRRLPPETRAEIRRLGHGIGGDARAVLCSAHDEGQACCLDILCDPDSYPAE